MNKLCIIILISCLSSTLEAMENYIESAAQVLCVAHIIGFAITECAGEPDQPGISEDKQKLVEKQNEIISTHMANTNNLLESMQEQIKALEIASNKTSERLANVEQSVEKLEKQSNGESSDDETSDEHDEVEVIGSSDDGDESGETTPRDLTSIGSTPTGFTSSGNTSLTEPRGKFNETVLFL